MPAALPPPPVAVTIEAARPDGDGTAPLVRWQEAQPPLRIPQSDIVVEVVGQLPLRAKLEDVTRLLGQRQLAEQGGNRSYPPTILELISFVKSNPARPRGRAWNSIRALSISYDAAVRHVTVEYCLDYCTPDPQTGAPHPRQTLVSYTASEQLVVTRLNKKLNSLQKYADRER